MTEKPTKVHAEELLQAAHDDWKLSDDAYGEQRAKELEDLRFEAGDHYNAEEMAYAQTTGRPAIVLDQTSGQIAKVTNQPVHRIVVLPNGGGSDPTSALYWQGICRRVEQLSDAESVYKWARRHAVVMGRGFWRIRHGYFSRVERRPDGKYDPSVFDQDIRIEPILVQHAVYEDPRCQALDFSDQRMCIIASDVAWDRAKALHKELKEHTAKTLTRLPTSPGDCPQEWANDRTVRIAERYWIEDETFTLCVVNMPTGAIGPDGQPLFVPTVVEKTKDRDYRELGPPLKEHTFTVPKVKWMKYVHGIVLETADVPGHYIPVVKIVGERRVIDGKDECRGMVRMAKTPQRLVDFYESRLASAVDLGAEGVWQGSVRAIGQWQELYANAHRTRPGVMLWNDIDEQGQPIAPPVFVHVAPQVQHLVVAAQRASMSLRAVLGVPDVQPEETRPEQSGRAIRARQQEQAQATSHFGEATKGGVRLTGRIVMSMGRVIYDAPRIFRINGKDDKEIAVLVSGVEANEADYQRLGVRPDQIEHMLRTDIGEFDVTVTAGQLRDTQRQETTDVLTGILPVLPPPMAVKAAGALVRQVDGLGELADTLAPPDDNGMVPREEAEAAIKEREAVIEQAKAEIQKLQQHIDAKRDELTVKRDIEVYKVDRDAETERYKADIDLRKASIQAQAAVLRPEPSIPEFGR